MRIETRDFFERLVGGWTSQAQAQGILVTRLGMLPTWEPALGVGEIIGVLEMMMDSAMAATLPGGLIEVMAAAPRTRCLWERTRGSSVTSGPRSGKRRVSAHGGRAERAGVNGCC